MATQSFIVQLLIIQYFKKNITFYALLCAILINFSLHASQPTQEKTRQQILIERFYNAQRLQEQAESEQAAFEEKTRLSLDRTAQKALRNAQIQYDLFADLTTQYRRHPNQEFAEKLLFADNWNPTYTKKDIKGAVVARRAALDNSIEFLQAYAWDQSRKENIFIIEQAIDNAAAQLCGQPSGFGSRFFTLMPIINEFRAQRNPHKRYQLARQLIFSNPYSTLTLQDINRVEFQTEQTLQKLEEMRASMSPELYQSSQAIVHQARTIILQNIAEQEKFQIFRILPPATAAEITAELQAAKAISRQGCMATVTAFIQRIKQRIDEIMGEGY